MRILQDCMFLWWPGKNCCNLAGRFWFICCIHQTLHLFVFHLKFLQNSLNKISVPWKAMKDTWNRSLLKKIKKIGEDEIMKLPEKWQKVVEQNVENVVQQNSCRKWKMYLLFFLLKPKDLFCQPIDGSVAPWHPGWQCPCWIPVRTHHNRPLFLAHGLR